MGSEAFEIDVYDSVVLDLMLPGLAGGGMEVCRRIRLLSSDTPILMLTALDSMHHKVEELDAGADDYLVKPFHTKSCLPEFEHCYGARPMPCFPPCRLRA